jgi:hypothetical protein
MKLKEKIDGEFARIASLEELGSATPHLVVQLEGGRLECDLTALDTIGCAFERFEYRTDKLADASVEQLQQLGRSLAARLKYLLEPIRPVEIDAAAGVVQMRSRPPDKDEGGTSYYELMARRGGGLCLRRYRHPSRRPRSVAPAHVTREVFHRLAADFVAALA